MKRIMAVMAVCIITNNAIAGDKMKIQINDTVYVVQTDDNKTVADIVANLPMDLNMQRYAGHEYFAEMDFIPHGGGKKTSHLMPGHVYWWGDGNTFVINYIEYDIAPYKSVHIGEITDPEIIDVLANAPRTIAVKLMK